MFNFLKKFTVPLVLVASMVFDVISTFTGLSTLTSYAVANVVSNTRHLCRYKRDELIATSLVLSSVFNIVRVSIGLVPLLVMSVLFFFVYFDGHLSVIDRYHKFRALNRLVKTQYKNMFRIVWISLEMVFQSWYNSFLQYMNNSLVKVGNNAYELKYTIKGVSYKQILYPVNGPHPISVILDENSEDMTDEVVSYFGVGRDFHKHPMTPRHFGVKELHIEFSDGTNKTFLEHETIHI